MAVSKGVLDPRSPRSRLVLAVLALTVCTFTAGCSVTVTTSPTQGPTDRGSYNVTVTHVTDGDTIDIMYANGTTDTVRLLGVDTPETQVETSPGEFEGVPDSDAGRAWLREWGDRASAFADERLDGKEVRITTDPMADRRGSYGRLLAYVYVNGTLFNLQLLEKGYARLYDSPFTRRDEFAGVEATAMEQDRGVWGYDGSAQWEPPRRAIRIGA